MITPQNESISLLTPLSLRSSLAFPLQSSRARREVIIGALWLLVPVFGWILNMGHRIVIVHNMMHGRPAWPSWNSVGLLLKHGLVTLGGMLFYYTPSVLAFATARYVAPTAFTSLGAILFILATIAIPGFMSHYCQHFDFREIFNPFLALRRCTQGGIPYWHAWAIAITALLLSLLGLFAFGVGFLATSVWFWQVAGFSFASVFTQRYSLAESAAT